MSSTRTWLKFVRVHTASLTIAGTWLGLVFGHPAPSILDFIIWGTFALLFHATGFALNNIYDLPWDKRDPAKKHFPLVSGEIPCQTAIIMVITGYIILIAASAILSQGHMLSLAAAVSAIGFGIAYNRGNKTFPRVAPILIAASFASLPLVPYFAFTYKYDPVFAAVVKYAIVLLLFQIAVSGFLKDVDVPQKNLLLKWGMKFENNYITWSKTTKIFAWKLHLFKIIILLYIAFITDVTHIFTLLIFFIPATWFVGKMCRDQLFNNRRIVSLATNIEIFSYFALISALFTATTIAFWFFIVFPILWFAGMNFATWKTLLRPRV